MLNNIFSKLIQVAPFINYILLIIVSFHLKLHLVIEGSGEIDFSRGHPIMLSHTNEEEMNCVSIYYYCVYLCL